MILNKHHRRSVVSYSRTGKAGSRPVEALEQRCLLSASISSGQTIAGNLTHAGQLDSYTFSAIVGDTFEVAVGRTATPATNAFLPIVKVIAGDGSVSYNDTNYYGSKSVSDIFTVPAGKAGTFTIAVQDKDPNAVGAYNIEMVKSTGALASDPNSDSGAITNGQTRTGAINYTGDIDAYTFSAAAGDTFEIALGRAAAPAGNVFHPIYHVFSPSGGQIVNDTNYYNSNSVSDLYTVPAGKGGTYTIVVQDKDPNEVGSYNVELVKSSGALAADPNADAGPIVSGQTRTGAINYGGDIDAYTFAAAAGDSVEVAVGATTAAGNTFHPWIRMFGPDGTIAINNTNYYNDKSLNVVYRVPAGKAGTYTIIMQDSAPNELGTYSLEVVKSSGPLTADLNGDSGAIAAGQNKVGAINYPGDIDAFTFSASVGDTFEAALGATSTAGNLFKPYIRIFAQDGTPVVDNGNYYNTASISNLYTVPAGKAGTFTIVVLDRQANDVGAYELDLTGNIHPTAPTIAIVPPANQTATATVSKTFTLGTFTASNTTSPYTVDVKWGDGTADTIFTTTNPGTIPGKAHTYAKAGTDTVSIVITDSKSHTSNKATFTVTVSPALASIAGIVFNDANANSKFDATELGLGLWQVYIDANKNGKYDTGDTLATTDADGNWVFKNLAAGTYTIRVVQRAGTASTTPTTGGLSLTLAAGQVVTKTLFGEKRIA